MWKGLVDKVQAYEEEPQVSDTSDEHWDNGVKTYNVTVEPRLGSDEDDSELLIQKEYSPTRLPFYRGRGTGKHISREENK